MTENKEDLTTNKKEAELETDIKPEFHGDENTIKTIDKMDFFNAHTKTKEESDIKQRREEEQQTEVQNEEYEVANENTINMTLNKTDLLDVETKKREELYITQTREAELETAIQTELHADDNVKKTIHKMELQARTKMQNELDIMQSNVNDLCAPCLRGKKESISSSWCLDCDEPLCPVCDTAHSLNKITMSHKTIVKETMKTVAAASVIVQQFCYNHPQIEVAYYCNTHTIVCCRACIPKAHRSCEDVLPLDDASLTIQNFSSFDSVSGAIERILLTVQNVENGLRKNVNHIKQDESVKVAVAQIKSKVIGHLNNLEQVILSQLQSTKDNVVSRLNSEIDALNSFADEIKRIKADLDFMIEHGARKQLFLLCQKLKEVITDKEVRLTEIISSHRHFSISLNPSVELDELEAMFKSFGVIKVTAKTSEIADEIHI